MPFDPTWTPYLLVGLSAIVIPSSSYLIRSTINSASKLREHEAVDLVQFKAIHATLTDLKNEQTNQTQKLDRLIERLIPSPSRHS